MKELNDNFVDMVAIVGVKINNKHPALNFSLTNQYMFHYST